jgi:ribosome recycling factor
MDQSKIRREMNEVLDLVTNDIGSIRTGRATPALVEGIDVSVYGGQQRLKINELATITATDAQSIIIDPWDKSIVGEIKKGIESANIGLTPSLDGEVIRINIPPMTTEDRQKYVKLLGTKIENGKIMIRQIRGDAVKDIKNAFEKKEMTEDEKFASEKHLQELTDEFVEKIDDVGERKEEELMRL